MSNSLDPDQARHFVGPDLGPNCLQKRPGRPKKTWDEVLVDDRKKLGMDSADPQNRSEWRGLLRRRLVKQAQPSVEENRL